MRTTYKVLAFTICALVGLQAASHAWVSAGIALFVEGGGVVDKALLEGGGPPPFPEVAGFMIHGINGMMVIPVVALALLVVGMLARFPGAIRWAAIVVGLVALQVTLGLLGHGVSALAFLHGLNALILFGAAAMAGMQRGRVARTAEQSVVAGAR